MFESKPFKRKERMITLLAWGTVLLPVMIGLLCVAFGVFSFSAVVGSLFVIGVIGSVMTLAYKYPLAAIFAALLTR